MGPKLRERLANIANLTSEELQQLIDDLTAAFDLMDDNGGSNDDLVEIADAIDSVKAEQDSRTSRQSVRDRVHASETPSDAGDVVESGEEVPDRPDEGVVQPGDPEGEDEGAEAEADADADTVTADPPPPTGTTSQAAAARPSLAQLSQNQDPNRQPPVASPMRASSTLLIGGDVAGFSTGQEITTSAQLSQAIVKKLQSLGRGGSPDRLLVASLIKEYPEERQLGEDPFLNDQKITAALDQAQVASGGICQPVTTDYAVSVIGSTARPLQAGLPGFNAVRGGVKYNVPPTLADVIGTPETWTIADDVAAETDDQVRKTCFRIECGDADEAYVYGIPVCLEVGNMMGRFTPEWITAQQSLLDVATARMAELTLLGTIDAGSVAVTATGVLGTIRTVLPTIDQLIAAYRYRHRLGSATVRVILPDWVRDEVRADLAMELAHNRSGDNNLAVTDAQINAYFASRNVNIIWMLEDIAGSLGGAQAAGAIKPWPASFVMYVFAEGTWQYLDGGQIDVGVVRDSALNAKNDYQIWREDFEGVAKRGNESLKVTVTTKPTGMSAGTLDTSG